MADFDVSSISGGRGSFFTQKSFAGTIPIGASGDILTIPASTGKRYRLNVLIPYNPVSESDIEIYADGVLVNQSNTSLNKNGSIAGFTVFQGGFQDAVTCIQDIVAKEIIVKKTTGTVVNQIAYNYSEGV